MKAFKVLGLVLLLASPLLSQPPGPPISPSGGASADPLTVLGPAAVCADNQLARWNGASATSLQCSVLTVADTTGNLTGPSGGFSIIGGTGVSDTLTLDSTSNATNGAVKVAAGNSFRLMLLDTDAGNYESLNFTASAGAFDVRPATAGAGSDVIALTLAGEGATGTVVLDGSDDVAGSVTVSAAGTLQPTGGLYMRSDQAMSNNNALMIGSASTSTFYVGNGINPTNCDAMVCINNSQIQFVSSVGGINWEGSTVDTNETVLVATNPTADRTITLPDATGTVQLSTLTQLTPTATPPAACAAGTEGSLYLDSDTHKLCYCNATGWVLASDDTTGCS